MHINTKVIFEWDKKKKEYVEVHSEGYEYGGEVAKCQYDEDILTGTAPTQYATAPGGTSQNPARTQWGGGPDYSQLYMMSETGELGGYLSETFGLGSEYAQYFGGFDQTPFGHIQQRQDIERGELGDIQRAAGKEYELGGQKLAASYGLGMQQVGLGREAIGTTARRGLRGVGQQRDVASMKANMANVGGITESYNRQKDYLMGDYSAGMQGYDVQAAGLKSDLTLGTTGLENILERAQQQYTTGMQRSSLGFAESTYGEERKQEDQFYDDLLVALEAQG